MKLICVIVVITLSSCCLGSRKCIANGSVSIWTYAEQLINDSVAKGILKK